MTKDAAQLIIAKAYRRMKKRRELRSQVKIKRRSSRLKDMVSYSGTFRYDVEDKDLAILYVIIAADDKRTK